MNESKMTPRHRKMKRKIVSNQVVVVMMSVTLLCWFLAQLAISGLAIPHLLMMQWQVPDQDQPLPPSILIVVPGCGDVKRLTPLKSSLDALRLSAKLGGIQFGCLVYIWKDDILDIATRELGGCMVLGNHGLWTHHMLQVGHNASQSLFETATHVAILMDDVDVRSVNVPRFIESMTRTDLDIAAPSAHGAFSSGQPRAHCRVHATGHVDMLFTVFTKPTYTCWQDMIDTTLNPHGWGYDIFVADQCRATVGVINHEYLIHRAHVGGAGNERQYDINTAFNEMLQWVAQTQQTNITGAVKNIEYARDVRPVEMNYCRDIQFRMRHGPTMRTINNKPSTTALQSGRERQSMVVEGLRSVAGGDLFITNNAQPTDPTNEQIRTIDFIDSIEDWFMTAPSREGVVLTDKWVGFYPEPDVSLFRLDPSAVSVPALHPIVVRSDDFLASSPNCIALFVFTSRMATMIVEQLKETNSSNLTICVVPHPIRRIQADSLFNPALDLKDSHAPLILWGAKSHDSVESLRTLRTDRRKIWFVQSTEVRQARNIVNSTHVDVVDVAKLSGRFLFKSVVLVDTRAEGSYVAAMNMLESQAPFLIRKLDGFVEYLGTEYPLFFTSLHEVQTLLDDSILLRKKMIEAHRYLKFRGTSHISFDSLSGAMVNCTLEAMANWSHV